MPYIIISATLCHTTFALPQHSLHTGSCCAKQAASLTAFPQSAKWEAETAYRIHSLPFRRHKILFMNGIRLWSKSSADSQKWGASVRTSFLPAPNRAGFPFRVNELMLFN